MYKKMDVFDMITRLFLLRNYFISTCSKQRNMVIESSFADFNTVDSSDLIKDELMDLK